MKEPDYDLAVIGAGVSGLSAAACSAERGASTVVFAGTSSLAGGLAANVGRLDLFPLPHAPSGAALVHGLTAACNELDVLFVAQNVTGLAPMHDGVSLTDAAGRVTTARSVIVASGARLRRLGVPGEAELTGRGVSQCDWCDGSLFRGESVLVVGGGDAAFQAALHLAGTCSDVTLVIRASEPKARRRYVNAAANDARIAFCWDTVVEGFVGSTALQHVVLRNVIDGGVEQRLAAGAFVFVGTEPEASFLPASAARDSEGRLLTDSMLRTSLVRVFAIGAVRSGYAGQIQAACGDAANAVAAALEAIRQPSCGWPAPASFA